MTLLLLGFCSLLELDSIGNRFARSIVPQTFAYSFLPLQRKSTRASRHIRCSIQSTLIPSLRALQKHNALLYCRLDDSSQPWHYKFRPQHEVLLTDFAISKDRRTSSNGVVRRSSCDVGSSGLGASLITERDTMVWCTISIQRDSDSIAIKQC